MENVDNRGRVSPNETILNPAEMRLRLSCSARGALMSWVMTAAPRECCGLLAGPAEVATIVLPVVNAATRWDRFETEPRSLLAALRRLREEGWNLLGLYHSHPVGPLQPSQTDQRENSWGETIPWWIVGPAGSLRAWRMALPEPVELTIQMIHSPDCHPECPWTD